LKRKNQQLARNRNYSVSPITLVGSGILLARSG